ncbi:2-nonaprenyl-3-methyl-6-methoxy-1,4-benzoquinol hydroxylase [Jeongeupia sp. HS-3]|uniref:2-polyprenyl-3-methyl-6-methoxy-1,4-benzoquinone monooxygenase n=1 Tax=Jeongeupia sp. HS-3 TaxID=1009682 RepID=UPI0018A527D6|nr:2-polyprenyl-3-methyl-6-methoxy-1,4-benzoquinone monooxygenase [Jeongeupia sp. HS-3]BCL76159.1 2-nonaprenyl-3-methyl-6-methoxy-1,4-benzoquinol hydroxylase [Jeongeupia sp. HS-3]
MLKLPALPGLPKLDTLVAEFDTVLRTLAAPATSARAHPDAHIDDTDFDEAEKRHAAGLMRVNHSGEICAQALYQGQALTARDPANREALRHAAQEEVEHLAWTERRIEELGSHKSVLNPLLYAGSLAIGVTAGVIGDKWNLGFLAETERQVGAHLQSHLQTLPVQDAKSRAIVEQMYRDEMGHADIAVELGAAELPLPLKALMGVTSKLMTSLSYRF